jgi:hypothetical protein
MRVAFVAIIAGLIAIPAAAAAQDLGSQPLAPDQLTAARGQLVTGGGLTFGFGAEIRTFVDGKLALESKLTLTDQGVVKTNGEQAGAEDGAAAMAGGISLPGFDPQDVTVLPGDGGATALIQTLTADQISSVVLNTANDRDIRQVVDLTFVLPQLAETQAQSNLQSLRSNLQSALDQALTR